MPNYNSFQPDPNKLKTLIYGSFNGTPVAVSVDSTGAVAVTGSVSATRRIAFTTNAYQGFTIAGTAMDYVFDDTNVSTMERFSFFVYGHSVDTDGVGVQLQISSDGTGYYPDAAIQTIAAGESIVLSTNQFLQYARVAYTGSQHDIIYSQLNAQF